MANRIAQPNATAMMPQGTLMNKSPNALLRAQYVSRWRGNDSRGQQPGERARTTQCQGQRHGNGTVEKDDGVAIIKDLPNNALLSQSAIESSDT